jgi:hypothetical protein
LTNVTREPAATVTVRGDTPLAVIVIVAAIGPPVPPPDGAVGPSSPPQDVINSNADANAHGEIVPSRDAINGRTSSRC